MKNYLKFIDFILSLLFLLLMGIRVVIGEIEMEWIGKSWTMIVIGRALFCGAFFPFLAYIL